MKLSTFKAPPEDRWFEDYPEGAIFEFGSITVTAEEILEFGRRFDPQAMHADPEQAASTAFGGLIASGWHTAGMMMRLFAEHFLSKVASIAAPAIDELRWPRPVRPGDVLRIRVEVIEARPSRTQPERGIVRSFVEVLNQHSEVVMSLKPVNLLRRRPRGQL